MSQIMKKFLLSLALTATILSGCSSKPENLSDNTYESACQALEVMDQYNNGDLDYFTTKKQD